MSAAELLLGDEVAERAVVFRTDISHKSDALYWVFPPKNIFRTQEQQQKRMKGK